MSHDSSNEGLKRVIGVPGLAATVINFSIGAGIYALPALIGLQLGTASILGYILCGIMFAAIMFCYVEIGSRVKTSGGSYAYVENAFGPFAGFVVNWLFFFGWSVLSDAALMNIVADSLSVLFPVFAGSFMRALLFAVILGLMIFVNVRDAKKSVRFVELVMIVKLLPLLAIILFGFTHMQMSNLHMEHFPSLKAFNDTALILFFALAGFESSLSVSGEIKDPKRTVPRGILLGGLTMFSIYVLIQIITQGVLGAEMSNYKDAPLAGIASRIAGTTGVTIMIFAATLSGLGAVNGDVLATPRLLFAGSKDGLFPKYLGKVHPKYATPHLAIITFAVLIFVLAISGGFKQLAVLASGALLLIYLSVVLATIKLRGKKEEEGTEKPVKAPGGLLIPGIAIAAILYVFSNLSRNEILSILGFVAVVCVIYWVMMRFKPAEN